MAEAGEGRSLRIGAGSDRQRQVVDTALTESTQDLVKVRPRWQEEVGPRQKTVTNDDIGEFAMPLAPVRIGTVPHDLCHHGWLRSAARTLAPRPRSRATGSLA